MNEEGPIREFMAGCGTGFGLALLVCVVLTVCFPFFMGMPGLHGQMSVDGILSTLFAVMFGGSVVFLVVVLVKKTARALSEKRFYYAMGLVSFALVPLLFFGACTMTIGSRPIVSPAPMHRNPTAVGVDSHQNRK